MPAQRRAYWQQIINCQNLKIFVLLILTLIGGCQEKPISEKALVQVRDKSINRSELALTFGLTEEQLDAGPGISDDFLAEAAKKWASEEILIQEANARRLDQDSLFLSRINMLRRGLLINRLYETVTASLEVDSAEVRQEYQSNREEYRTHSDQIELLYVIAPTRESATEIRKNLQDGKDLGDILQLDDQLKGEDLSWVSKEELDPRLATPAMTLTPGGISYPLKYGEEHYIVLQCRQRRLAGTILPLEEVESEIRGHVYLRKQMQAEQALRDSLWAAYNPKIMINSTKSDTIGSEKKEIP